MERHTDKQIDRQTERPIHGQTNSQGHILPQSCCINDRQTDKLTYRQTDKRHNFIEHLQADRQTHIQTDRQIWTDVVSIAEFVTAVILS